MTTKSPVKTLRDAVADAEAFINQTYLDHLSVCPLIPPDKKDALFHEIRFYRVRKIVYDKDENVIDKLISVYAALGQFANHVALLVRGRADGVELYFGVRSVRDIKVAGRILHDAFAANFPGSRLEPVEDAKGLLESVTKYGSGGDLLDDFASTGPSVECISVTPSLRGEKQETFVQGLEKFIDALRNEEYACMILATPVSREETDRRRQGLEEIASALSPFLKTSLAQGKNDSVTDSDSVSESVSTSISNGISLATGTSSSYSKGKQSGFSLGASFLVNFGLNGGSSETLTDGTSTTKTTNEGTSEQTGRGTSVTRSTAKGTSETSTTEYKNKAIEELLKKIDVHLTRLSEGEAYGLWDCAAYMIAPEKKTVAIASGAFRSLVLGEKSGADRTHTNFIRAEQTRSARTALESLRCLEHPRFQLPDNRTVRATNTVSGRELPIILSMPRRSLSGVIVSEQSAFGRNVLSTATGPRVPLGRIHYMDQTEAARVELDADSLTAHCFITGSTGSGKSNTVYTLLQGLGQLNPPVPFLVIEPAKGEYRKQFGALPGLNVYGTNPAYGQILKLNPFRFPDGVHVLEHLDRLIEIFNACWEMYAAMPAILKEATERAYIAKGWDLYNSVYAGRRTPVFPTFYDLLAELPKVIAESGYSADTKGDYTGALVTRVHSLTNGIYGQIFCDDFDTDDADLFDCNAILDLSRVGSSETKSLIMGMVVLRLTERRMSGDIPMNAALRHVTVLEEAHNLLKNTNRIQGAAGNQVVAKSVEMIVNSIAEMRTYGEGFLIVDQSPTSVDIAAVKNTNTKIIMRLPEKDDCELAGHSVSLNEGQTAELARLDVGIAVVMQSDWTEAVQARIDRANNGYVYVEPPLSYDAIRDFRSAVLSALLEEYAFMDGARDVEHVLRVVEQFDIRPVVKESMKRTIRSLCGALDEHFDSLLLGRTLLRLCGCADAFRISARRLRADKSGAYTDESVKQWRAELRKSMTRYVELDQRRRNILIQYMVHAQKFERRGVDYAALYRQLYEIKKREAPS